MVAADFHAPFIKESILERMFQVREKYKIDNLLIPGDFFDEMQFSGFDVSPEDAVDFDEELESARALFKSLKSEFKNIYISLGNHDVRLWRLLMRMGKATENSWKSIFNLVDKNINVSQYRYMEVNNYWRITHAKAAMKLGSFPIVRLRAKLDKSIVLAHGHWWGQLFDPSGKYYFIATGMMGDPLKIAYHQLWDTSHDQWINGFLMVTEKVKPILFNENTPWGIYLKDRLPHPK